MRTRRYTTATTIVGMVASTLGIAVAGTAVAPAASAVNGAWSHVGPAATGPNNRVFSMVQDGSGNIYAAGIFSGANGEFVSRYDKAGESWGLATSSDFLGGQGAYALALNGSDLYVGGRFTVSGLTGSNNVVKISNPGPSVAATALASGLASPALEAWDGVEKLAYGSSKLYATGKFETANTKSGLAQWDGTSWSALASGLTGATKLGNGLAIIGSDLYIGGQFDGADNGSGTVASKGVVKWDGTAFSSLNQGLTTPLVTSFVKNGTGPVYVGGTFTTPVGSTTDLNGIATWDGTSFGAVGSPTPGITGSALNTNFLKTIEVMAFDSSGNLYVGGNFTSIAGVAANGVAKFDATSSTWEPLGCGANNGVNDVVRAILPQSDGSVILGGFFTNVGGDPTNDYVVKYTPGADNCPAASSGGGGPAAGTPSAPQNVKATYDDDAGALTISWDAPATDNGSPIVQYLASTLDGHAECFTNPSTYSCTIRAEDVQLPFLKPYSDRNAAQSQSQWPKVDTVAKVKEYFANQVSWQDTAFVPWANGVYVQARNSVGWGAIGFAPQRGIFDVFPSSQPRNVVATSGWNKVTVDWEKPASRGTYPITNYLVTSTPGNKVCISTLADASLTQCTFTALTPGVKYTFKVQALNGAGWSEASLPSGVASPRNLKITKYNRKKQGFLFGGDSDVSVTGVAPGYANGTKVAVWYRVAKGSWIEDKNARVTVKGEAFSWAREFQRKLNRDDVSIRFSVNPTGGAGQPATNPVSANDNGVTGWSNQVVVPGVK